MGRRGIGTVLAIVGALLMAIPLANASGLLAPSSTGNAAVLLNPLTKDTSCAVGTNPHSDAYDPVNHDLYVPNSGSGNLTVLTGACKIVATIGFPKDALPIAAAFDPTNNEVYVTDAGLNQVYVISGDTLVGTITGFDGAWGIAFDPGIAAGLASGMVVANSESDSLVMFTGNSEASELVEWNLPTGKDPKYLAFDPADGRLVVTNSGSNNVTSYAFSFTEKGESYSSLWIPVGTDPVGIAWDPIDGFDYVTNAGSNNVSVVCDFCAPSPGSLPTSIPVGSQPRAIVWDQTALSLYVVNYGSNNVSVINVLEQEVTRTIKAPSGSGLLGIDYDAATGKVYVTAYNSGLVYEYS